MERKQLDTQIEKEAYLLTQNIKNHALSFTHLYARKTGMKVDPALLEKFVEIFGLALEDGFQSQIEIFNRAVGKALDKYTAEENPMPRTSSRKKATE